MERMMVMRWTRHNFNALHLYCRLRDMGLSKVWAGRVARLIEPMIKTILY